MGNGHIVIWVRLYVSGLAKWGLVSLVLSYDVNRCHSGIMANLMPLPPLCYVIFFAQSCCVLNESNDDVCMSCLVKDVLFHRCSNRRDMTFMNHDYTRASARAGCCPLTGYKSVCIEPGFGGLRCYV
jgi:hypothetical protein